MAVVLGGCSDHSCARSSGGRGGDESFRRLANSLLSLPFPLFQYRCYYFMKMLLKLLVTFFFVLYNIIVFVHVL